MIIEQTSQNKEFANRKAVNKKTGQVRFFTVSGNSDLRKELGSDWIVSIW